MSQVSLPRRPKALEAGLFLVVVATPLAFAPFTTAPFVDVKLLVISIGALFLWVARTEVDRRIAVLASIWLGVCFLAALVGVDRWNSIFGGQNQDTGVLLLGIAGYLLAVGARLPDDLVGRLPSWLLGAGLAAAVVELFFRFFPGTSYRFLPHLYMLGSTLGLPVFLDAFLAVALVASTAVQRLRGWRILVPVTILSCGLGSSSERSGVLLPLIGLAVWAWRARPGWKRAVLVIAPVAAVLSLWISLAGPPPFDRYASFGTLSAQLQTGSDERARLVAIEVFSRASLVRPVLGWGPENGISAFLATASPRQVGEAFGRGTADAHNILVQLLVTTGFVGLAAFLLLWGGVLRRLRGSPPGLGWAVAGFAALAAHAFVEPMNVANTSLLFLLAGVAISWRRSGDPTDGSRPGKVPRALVGAGLVIACMVSAGMMLASVFEQWGATHYAEWALRASLDIQPWRLSAAERLALNYAVDGCSSSSLDMGDAARALIERQAASHPWDPSVRLMAASIDQLLSDSSGVRTWLESQVARFPADGSWIAGKLRAASAGGCIPASAAPPAPSTGPSP